MIDEAEPYFKELIMKARWFDIPSYKCMQIFITFTLI